MPNLVAEADRHILPQVSPADSIGISIIRSEGGESVQTLLYCPCHFRLNIPMAQTSYKDGANRRISVDS
jgi:hypothetical protein